MIHIFLLVFFCLFLFLCNLFKIVYSSNGLSFIFLLQILIELETALLDDQPHWYKLQTHDVSSLPLPQPSPYLPRRHVHNDSPSKKLQSECHVCSSSKAKMFQGIIRDLYPKYELNCGAYKHV